MEICNHGDSRLALVSLVATACDGVFMSKTADLCTVAHSLRVLVPMFDRLVSWTDNLGSWPFVRKTRFDIVLSWVVFHREQDDNCTCVELGDPLFLYCRCTER